MKQDEGRKEKGSGRPTLRPAISELNGKPALVFRRQELVCMDDDTFDGEIARFLIWERSLSDEELEHVITTLKESYIGK